MIDTYADPLVPEKSRSLYNIQMKLPSSKIMNLSYWSLPHHNQHKWLVWVGMEMSCINVMVWLCVLKVFWKFVPAFGSAGGRGCFLMCLGKNHGVELWLMGSEFSLLPSLLLCENTGSQDSLDSSGLLRLLSCKKAIRNKTKASFYTLEISLRFTLKMA